MTLAERITTLHQQRDQTIAALNQVIGAIAICEQIQKDYEAEAINAAIDEVPKEKPEPGTYHDPLVP